MKKYDKMIRTKIPYIISNEGKISTIETLSGDSDRAKDYIAKKILEEAQEVFDSRGSVNDATEELADLYETMLALTDSLGISWDSVVEAAEEKAIRRGKFVDEHGNILILKQVDG
jgi:predicted house-cleaning noncanonical NTP pyrophosphatase (MazG superfamily)